MYDDGVAGRPPAPTRRTAVLNTLKLPPAGPLGTYSYSNAGYMTAGGVLEKKANVAWESLIRSRLFVPLGMTSCGFGPPATYPSSVDQPWGHVEETSGAATPIAPGPASDNPPSIGPAGYVHCSLVDWGKFLEMHARGARGEATLVSVASMARLHAPPPTGEPYAAGWSVLTRDWAGGTVFTHTGSNTLFWAATWIAPANDLVIVAASNSGADRAGAATDEALVPLVDAYGLK